MKHIIVIIIIVASISLLYATYTIYGTNASFVEGFVPKNSSHISDLYDTGMSTPSRGLRDDIRYVTANNQQLIYKELVHMFNDLSSAQSQHLVRTVSTMYKPETIEEDIRDELNQVTNILLDYIKSTSNEKYIFSIDNYDNIWIYEDERGNKQYDYDVFVQDPYNNFNIRLKVDIIKYISDYSECDAKARAKAKKQKEDSHLNEVRDDFDTYPIGPGNPVLPPKVIANPMDVIVTGLDILNSHITTLPNLPKIYSVYLNAVQIYNSNEIVNPDQFCSIKRLPGIGSSPVNLNIDPGTINKQLDYGQLDYGQFDYGQLSKMDDANEPVVQAMVETWPKRNEWIAPPGEDTALRKEPICNPADAEWGYLGTMKLPTQPCEGISDATKKRPYRAEFNPTLAHSMPRWTGTYDWLNELDRKDARTATW